MFDTNGDGTIDVSELRNMLKEMDDKEEMTDR